MFTCGILFGRLCGGPSVTPPPTPPPPLQPPPPPPPPPRGVATACRCIVRLRCTSRLLLVSSARHQRVINASSTRHQRVVNASSTRHRRAIDASSTLHQRVINASPTRRQRVISAAHGRPRPSRRCRRNASWTARTSSPTRCDAAGRCALRH